MGDRFTALQMGNMSFEGVCVDNQENKMEELSPEKAEKQRQRRLRRAKWKRAGVVLDRIFGFLLATVIVFGLTGLGVEYILIKGPSPALKETFVMTMLETRRFGFIPRIFLTQDEVDEYRNRRAYHEDVVSDPSLIQIPNRNEDGTLPQTEDGSDPYGLVDEDGDGVIIEEVKGKGFSGKMMIVLDPSRCFIADGGAGMTIDMMAEKYGAIGGINAGAFYDPGGTGAGGQPEGLTIYDGRMANFGLDVNCIAGFDDHHILRVGYMTHPDVEKSGIVSCVTFGPPLVVNGEAQTDLFSSVNPRTAIGQRADGAILMLVIDGRQASGLGATYSDLRDVMLDYGAVNACNMDGGSSTVMYFNGQVINMPSSASGGSRWLPNAFLFK